MSKAIPEKIKTRCDCKRPVTFEEGFCRHCGYPAEHTGDTLTQKVNEIIEYLKPEIDVGKDVNSTDKLAEDLAMYFQDAGETVSNGPCSCMGVSCSSLGCVALWQSVLANPKILDEAMALYRNYKC